MVGFIVFTGLVSLQSVRGFVPSPLPTATNRIEVSQNVSGRFRGPWGREVRRRMAPCGDVDEGPTCNRKGHDGGIRNVGIMVQQGWPENRRGARWKVPVVGNATARRRAAWLRERGKQEPE